MEHIDWSISRLIGVAANTMWVCATAGRYDDPERHLAVAALRGKQTLTHTYAGAATAVSSAVTEPPAPGTGDTERGDGERRASGVVGPAAPAPPPRLMVLLVPRRSPSVDVSGSVVVATADGTVGANSDDADACDGSAGGSEVAAPMGADAALDADGASGDGE